MRTASPSAADDPIDAGYVSANEHGLAVIVFDVGGWMQVVGDEPDHRERR